MALASWLLGACHQGGWTSGSSTSRRLQTASARLPQARMLEFGELDVTAVDQVLLKAGRAACSQGSK